MSRARVAVGLPVAGLCLIVFGSARRIAQLCRSEFGRSAPVMFNRLLCLILSVRVRRFGAPSAAARRLIVSNHVSWPYIPALGALEPMTFLAKKEIGAGFLGREI